MNEAIKQVPNRPTEFGRQLGEQIARLTDRAWQAIKDKFPNHMQPCKTCAFVKGTLPNGCEPTVMDAMKCVVEKKPFMCHQTFDADGNPTDFCAGWMIATAALADLPPLKAPYEFSE